ncbi:MAG TPA: glycosyltransferase [Nitrospirota bacterium]|nr:glycosyltransferase [Nitrospirota bacterium]
MERKRHHITVCICTYKREEMLARLLKELKHQSTDDLFTYSVVIVDNDYTQTARHVVEGIEKESNITIDYYCEPEQNIALARNKAVQNASGDLLAFIDDDEVPTKEWLLNLYKAIYKFNVSGILGPVLPYFETSPPNWVVRSQLCERKSFESGTIIRNPIDTRTGNVLLDRNVLFDKNPFDYRFGKTGGEDVDFFRRLMERGNVFVWSNEAHVYEFVPQYRLKRKYFIKRALLRGVVSASHISIISFSTLKSIIALIVYTVVLPILLLMGHHLFMKYLIKDCDHLGKLMALCGVHVIKERPS